MAPHRDDDDSADDFETKTPPIIGVGDPVVLNELKKLWRRLNEVAKGAHEANNALAIHNAQDEAAFERMEEHMTRANSAVEGIRGDLKELNDQAKLDAERRVAAEKADSDRRTSRIITIALACFGGIGTLIGIYVAIRSDITDLRAKQDSQRERVDSIDRTLDKVDEKLDRALSRGIRPAPATTPDLDTP